MLPKIFGHSKFRDGQRQALSNILNRKSCLVVFPTGLGKSLIYMIAAQILNGITLVVSPLIALMNDQVEYLRSRGITACKFDGTMSVDEVHEESERLLSGTIKILFVSPERFNNENFRKLLSKLQISLFVVDEAHCISEWGHSFRPEYLRLSKFADLSKAQVRLALTATATTRVADDILLRLNIERDNLIRLPSLRKNLHLIVSKFPYSLVNSVNYEQKHNQLMEMLSHRRTSTGVNEGGATIVYVHRQKLAETLASDLSSRGFNCRSYHGGMDVINRTQVEDWFLSRQAQDQTQGQGQIVVATTAFGMGIDRGDIRCVVHFDLPRSIEDYVQGAGRAGRDGCDADCFAYFSSCDISYIKSQILGTTPSKHALTALVDQIYTCVNKHEPGIVYLNFYDLSRDLDESQILLELSISHLVYHEHFDEITPLFGVLKIGNIDENILNSYLSSSAGAEFQDLSTTVGRHLLFQFSSSKRPRKWIEVNVIQLAEEFQTSPIIITRILNNFIRHGVCVNGGVSKIYSRFRVMTDFSHIPRDDIVAMLHGHAQNNERRSLHRLQEVVSLFQEHCTQASTGTTSNMWDQIESYFSDTTSHSSNSDWDTPSEDANHSVNKNDSEELFNEDKWNEISILVASGSIPNDDPVLITRFATGVNSPRLLNINRSLKRDKSNDHSLLFGSLSFADWNYVLQRSNDLIRKTKTENEGSKYEIPPSPRTKK